MKYLTRRCQRESCLTATSGYGLRRATSQSISSRLPNSPLFLSNLPFFKLKIRCSSCCIGRRVEGQCGMKSTSWPDVLSIQTFCSSLEKSLSERCFRYACDSYAICAGYSRSWTFSNHLHLSRRGQNLKYLHLGLSLSLNHSYHACCIWYPLRRMRSAAPSQQSYFAIS